MITENNKRRIKLRTYRNGREKEKKKDIKRKKVKEKDRGDTENRREIDKEKGKKRHGEWKSFEKERKKGI